MLKHLKQNNLSFLDKNILTQFKNQLITVKFKQREKKDEFELCVNEILLNK